MVQAPSGSSAKAIPVWVSTGFLSLMSTHGDNGNPNVVQISFCLLLKPPPLPAQAKLVRVSVTVRETQPQQRPVFTPSSSLSLNKRLSSQAIPRCLQAAATARSQPGPRIPHVSDFFHPLPVSDSGLRTSVQLRLPGQIKAP